MVLLARDIMDPKVITVDGEMLVRDCAQYLSGQHRGYAVVLGPRGEVEGIVTEWDFLSKVTAGGGDPTALRVREIATPILRSCGPETPAEDLVETMATEGIRRMLVRSGAQIVGIVTSRDVLVMFRQYIDKLSSQIAGYRSDPPPLG
ncbi:MAG TPA: CBS domain-containing protein [Thermoplasmata archaeon]|nr:CBS domain-containing protein [Thermoplasmata archaeon]